MRLRTAVVLLLVAFAGPKSAEAAGPPLDLPKLTAAQVERFGDRLTKAQEAMKDDDFVAAAGHFQQAIAIYAGSAAAWYDYACVQARRGRQADAVECLRRAAEGGWSDAAWPAQDPDLESLRELPAFKQWVRDVAAAGTAPPRAFTDDEVAVKSGDQIAELAEQAGKRVEDMYPVIGGRGYMQRQETIARWSAACWDRLARVAADAAVAEQAEWSALSSLTERYQPKAMDLAADVAARADAFASRHPSSEHASEARFTGASARRYAAWAGSPEDVKAAAARYKHELLLIAAADQGGRAGVQQAYAGLIALHEDDLPVATLLHSKLRALMGDERAFLKLVGQEARGVHYRIAGLPPLEATTLDGRRLTRESLAGKVTLLDFWATWCGPCVGELPHVREALAKYGDRGFEVIGISLDSGKDGDAREFKAWCAKHDVTWPQVFDGKGGEAALAELFGVTFIPFPLLIGRDGKVAFADGQLRGPQLLDHVGALMGEATAAR